MVRFICKECGYKTEGEGLKKCPYCDKSGLQEEQTASDLLNEVEKVLE